MVPEDITMTRALSAIWNYVSEMVIVLDPACRILWINNAAEKVLQLPLQEIVGYKCYQLWYGTDQPCLSCPVKKARIRKEITTGEIRTADGRVWLVRAFPLVGDDGAVGQVVELVGDITGYRQTEYKLRHLSETFVNLGLDFTVNFCSLVETCRELLAADQVEYRRYRVSDQGQERNVSSFVFSPNGAPVEQTEETYFTVIEQPVLIANREVGLLRVSYKKPFVPCSIDWYLLNMIAAALAQQEEKYAFYRASQLKEEQWRLLIENASDLIVKLDRDLFFRYVSPNCEHILGYKPGELQGRSVCEILISSKHTNGKNRLEQLLTDRDKDRVYEVTVRCRHASGKKIWLACRVTPLPDREGEGREYVCICRDVTRQRLMEQRLHYLSYRDALTGLYNRAYFEQEMRRLADESQIPMGIIVCDVNNLKHINDTYGHREGDRVLKAAARLLRKCFRRSDTIARIGGDEFAVLLPVTPHAAVEAAVQRIRQEVKNVAGETYLSLAVGYAVAAEAPLNMEDLFRRADAAMYTDKREQRTRG